ncbi:MULTISPECIES: hypothetical protein [Providencia]|uniref:hypothetical protein n=1 Tax=Providencia TaxID=586 RepID=UPI00234A8785|nr:MULTISPECIES: hypothetical protein [Providencia]ELR5224217.1 hypothetical protein [Providencia rettgeri]MDX7324347.1 hypothetical protein [Providencia rettgeri]
MNSRQRYKLRRKEKRMEQRKEESRKVNSFDVMAQIIVELKKLKSAPDTRKQQQLRKPIMSDSSVTARG